jgi:Zn-dependent membrane protease YugP
MIAAGCSWAAFYMGTLIFDKNDEKLIEYRTNLIKVAVYSLPIVLLSGMIVNFCAFLLFSWILFFGSAIMTLFNLKLFHTGYGQGQNDMV